MRFWRTPLDDEKFTRPSGRIHIIVERCKGCAFCVEYCPKGVLVMSEEFNAKGKALLAERRASRALWRTRAYGNLSSTAKENNWLPEWGPAPKLGTKTMYPFLDKKAEEEGIYRRMIEHIESPENTFHPKVAYEEISKRDAEIAGDIKRVRDIFLRGTKPEDFNRLAEALASEKPTDRAAYAELVKKHVRLPIAQRTYITAFGEIAGEETEFDYSNLAQGPLSVGYGKHPRAMGPEYAFGITFERLVDGPVLIVKCSWGGTSVHSNWRPPSLRNFETPIERATRMAAGKDRQIGTGACLERTLAHIQNVLGCQPNRLHRINVHSLQFPNRDVEVLS